MMTRLQALRPGMALGSLIALIGCAHVAAPPPEPIVRTVEVRVPVPQPCPALQRLGPAPVYPDTDAALRMAPDIAVRVGLLLAGRVLRKAREAALTAAVNACQ